MKRAVHEWSVGFVLDKLAKLSWLLTTTFSGLGCLELAAKSVPCLLFMCPPTLIPPIAILSLAPSEVEAAAKNLLVKSGAVPAAKISIGPAADFCKHSQKVLMKTWKNRCMLLGMLPASCVLTSDLHIVPNVPNKNVRFGDVLQWRDPSKPRGLVKSAYCLKHKKLCRLPGAAGNQTGRNIRVEAAGASCTPFSVAGKRLKARTIQFWRFGS